MPPMSPASPAATGSGGSGNGEGSPYVELDRAAWARLGAATEQPLSADEIERVRGLGEQLDLDEVTQVYLPLSRLLSLYVESAAALYRAQEAFLDRPQPPRTPFVIGLAGSVAVGKSTTARLLQQLLAHWPAHPAVALVTTDGFLYPNAELVRRPDIVIIEGLNVLLPARVRADGRTGLAISDFFDFSVYVDAATADIRNWYTDRFLRLRETAFRDPASYFSRYAGLTEDEAVQEAHRIWDTINGPNLKQNVQPTRGRATLVLRKDADHSVRYVRLRKL